MNQLSASDLSAADALLQQGLEASRADRADDALAFFHRAAELAPQAGVPHFLIGAELAQLGRMEEAEAAYANAVLLAPSLQMARYQLGLLQFTSSRPAVALVTWGPLFQLPPDSALQRIVHGFAALAQDDFAAALSAFREGMALNTDNEALNRDVQMLIDRIEARDNEKPSASPTASTVVPAEEPAAEDEGLHVLLANYQHQGPPH